MIEQHQLATTAEQLMRSRYSAYVTGNIAYIEKTMQRKALAGFDNAASNEWSSLVHWLKLEVLDHQCLDEYHASVTFKAHYIEENTLCQLMETSQFERINGLWYYTDGTPSTTTKKLSLNQTCPCGSGKKFKRCCRK